ncbi:MAG: alpha/beta fold hydrolase [Pseudomonadota bacterium]
MTTSPTPQPDAIHFTLPDVDIHGLRWGAPGSPNKVIALHGWLDNCASFSRLLPLVPDIDCVALDLAGHGRSGHRAGHSAYNIWEDLRDIHAIAEQLGWSSFFLLGHSRGAAVAMLYSGTFPDTVRGAFMIDGLVPMPGSVAQLPANLADAIRAMRSVHQTTPAPSYFEDYDAATEARTKGAFPLSPTAAGLLAERAVCNDAERGYYWHYDRRLKLPSELRLTLQQSVAFLDNLPTPVAVVVASQGVLPRLAASVLKDGHRNVELLPMDGGHHLHVADDEATRVRIAEAFMSYVAARA